MLECFLEDFFEQRLLEHFLEHFLEKDLETFGTMKPLCTTINHAMKHAQDTQLNTVKANQAAKPNSIRLMQNSAIHLSQVNFMQLIFTTLSECSDWYIRKGSDC